MKVTSLMLILILSFLCNQNVKAQVFTRCQDSNLGYKANLKFASNKIMYNAFNYLIIGSNDGFDCESNQIFETSNVKLRDFYPITDDEFIVNNNYKSLVRYDINSKTVKNILFTDNDDGILDIFRNNESTFVGGYGKYYVNHDNLMTNNWHEIILRNDVYVVDMNFVSNEFIELGI